MARQYQHDSCLDGGGAVGLVPDLHLDDGEVRGGGEGAPEAWVEHQGGQGPGHKVSVLDQP